MVGLLSGVGLLLAEQVLADRSSPSPRCLVPPLERTVVAGSACRVGTHTLILVTQGSLWRADLDTGRQRPLVEGGSYGAVAAAGASAFWATAQDGTYLVRMDLSERILERHRLLPHIAWSVASAGDELVVARVPTPWDRARVLLYKGVPPSFGPWALPLESPTGDPFAGTLSSAVALDTDGRHVAVVWQLGRSEVAAIARDGRVVFRRSLPYFGEAFCPLVPASPASSAVADETKLAKPYRDVAVGGGRIWCLSFQEGPWHGADTRIGRHVVEVALDGEIRAVRELRVDGAQILTSAAGEPLVVDTKLGVYRLADVWADGR